MEETPRVFHIRMESVSDKEAGPTQPNASHLPKSLTVLTATIFMAGGMAGSGVLALPRAVADSEWIGLVLIMVCCANAGYTGSRLGSCWTILEERDPELLGTTRSPYPTIAFKAYGVHMKRVVSVCVTIALYGTGTVFLLLVAKLLQGLTCSWFSLSYCFWLLAIGACLTPLTWLGTPKDFWPIAVGALVTTTIACFLIFVQTLLDNAKDTTPAPEYPPLAMLYVPVAAAGYFVYGGAVERSVVDSLTPGVTTKIVQSLLALHLFCAFCIVMNPICQELEEHLHLPKTFGWKRCAFRTVVVCTSIFLALSIPNFGNIMSLVGGSTTTLLSFVFPALFYMKLCDQKNPAWPETTITLHERVYMWALIMIGVFGGATATWSAVSSIVSSVTFTVPCYINPYAENYVSCHK